MCQALNLALGLSCGVHDRALRFWRQTWIKQSQHNNSKCLWSAYYMPGVCLSTSLTSAQLFFTAALKGGCFYNPHFPAEKTEATK